MAEESITTQRRGEVFLHEGYMFQLEKSSLDGLKKYWRCSRRNDKCKARIHTCVATNQVVKFGKHQHNHDVCTMSVEVAKAVTGVKRRAVRTMEQPAKLINAEIENLSDSALRGVQRNNLRRIVHRLRTSVEATPPNPLTLTELMIPQRYTTIPSSTGHDEKFLLHDTGPSKERIIVFGNETNLQWARNPSDLSHLFVDGTFSTTPSIYKDGQLCVVLMKKQDWVFPLLYALLPNKTQSTYTTLFRVMKQLMPSLNPRAISMDFELAAHQAAQTEFPSAQIFGCFFHFTKNMKQHLQLVPGAMQRYRSDATFALHCKTVAAVAFLPQDKVYEALICLECNLPEDVMFLVDWLEDTYVGRPSRLWNGERRPAIFPVPTWNVHDRVIHDQDKAESYAEGEHHRLKCDLGVEYSTFWKFIDGLKAIQKSRDKEHARMMAGLSPPQKFKKYREADDRIRKLVVSFDGSDNAPPQSIWDFLYDVSHNFQMDE